LAIAWRTALADRQEQALGDALGWASAQGQANMMHNALQTRRPACERARRGRFQALGENLLVALGHSAAEPARPPPDADKPPLCESASNQGSDSMLVQP
jgi:hypothetical protein